MRADTTDAHSKTGMVLGVVADTEYPLHGPVPLGVGDLLFMRTDGVEETMNADREAFGEERLIEVLNSCRGKPADEALAAVERALTEHRGALPQEDDLTMVALRVVER